MTRLTILYNHPEDPAAFDRYYREVHIPLARKIQGFKGWTMGKFQSQTPGEKPEYYMVVNLYADSREELERIFGSPGGVATMADVSNFAPGGATFLYHDEEVMIPVSVS